MAKIRSYHLDKQLIGEQLKAVRKRQNLNQSEIADYLGMTGSAYASIERGTYATRVEVLAKIIIFYAMKDVDLYLEELIGLDEYLKPRRLTPKIGEKLREMEILLRAKDEEIKAMDSERETLKKTNAQLNKIIDKVTA